MAASVKTLITIRVQHLGMIISDSGEGESLFNFGSASVFAELTNQLSVQSLIYRVITLEERNAEPSEKTSLGGSCPSWI